MKDHIEPQNRLNVTIGQYSTAGIKDVNQDFYGAVVSEDATRVTKGITVALADGISSSPISQEASKTAIQALLSDYYCTSDAWSVKTAVTKVISATNSWLFSQNRHARISDMNLGRVCTLSALVLKGQNVHIFHVGDSRIWRVTGNSLEPLTEDHRVVLSEHESYLARSLGSEVNVEIDYTTHTLNVGDVFVLTTDGVHDFWNEQDVISRIKESTDLDSCARELVDQCLAAGSNDNLTLQIVRIDSLAPEDSTNGLLDDILTKPLSNLPKTGDTLDGFTIIRNIVSSARSHIYLASAPDGTKVVLKFPSADLQQNDEYLRRIAMEEWIARRIKSPHVLGAVTPPEERSCLYTVTEFVEGQTLRQWMHDNPQPPLEEVRRIVEQVALGLRAFHRREMIHQDLRPENIMIDKEGTVKIIDFGSTRVAGAQEISPVFVDDHILGTIQYSAPEYFLGYDGTSVSDLYSLGAITFEMLSGQLPYGPKVQHVRTHKDLRKLVFRSTLAGDNPLPDWIEFALQRAVHLDANRRYQVFTEFLKDLREPSPEFRKKTAAPLIEKNPVKFWQMVSLFFAATTLALLLSKF